MTIDKYVRRYYKGDEKMMGYAILAYFIGLMAGSIIAELIAIFHPLPLLPFLGVALPVFIGSILAGYFARYKGWLVAFTLTLLIAFCIRGCDFHYVDVRYPTPYTLKWVVVGLVISMAAGYLGQLLAQIWHKRSHKKADASKSETT